MPTIEAKIMKFLRTALVLSALAAALAQAQTLSVTFPGNNEVLGKTNQIKFLATDATSQVRIVATVTKTDDATTKFTAEGFFDPDSVQRVLGSLDLNFDEATPSGTYTLVVQLFAQGSLRQTQTINNIKIDTRNPRFRNVSPVNNSFVNNNVSIKATLDEANTDKWRVRVSDKDIPNNTGNNNDVSVVWNTANVENDGAQSISIKVDDKAKNVATRTINVTLDRVNPAIEISSPTNVTYRPGSIIPVIINVNDQFSGSVANTGVNAVIKTLDGRYIAKVARKLVRNNETSLQWIGRIRHTSKFPNSFKIVVTAQDRAGNRAQTQEIIVNIGGN